MTVLFIVIIVHSCGDSDAPPLQMSVRAYDLGSPSRASGLLANVQISIIRNLNCPSFTNLPTTIDVPVNEIMGAQVYSVAAIDNDSQVNGLRLHNNMHVCMNLDASGFIMVLFSSVIFVRKFGK